MIKKNIPKIITFFIILILISIPIYRNYIYYMIPYNPLDEYYHTAQPYLIQAQTYTDKNNIYLSTSDYKTEKNNEIIFQYFKNLKLIPLSGDEESKKTKLLKNLNRIGFKLTFSDFKPILINELYLDNPTYFRISSQIVGFPNGYYKIIDDEFDYNYIINLMKDDKYLYY